MKNDKILTPDHNSFVLGETSIQKYNNIFIPYILKIIELKESFMVVDTSGIILKNLGEILIKEGYNIVSFDLKNTDNSVTWNPLLVPLREYRKKNYELCIEQLTNLGTFIMADVFREGTQDPFWGLSATDLFVGFSLILFKEAKDDSEINIKSIYKLAETGFSKFSSSTIIEKYLRGTDKELEKIKMIMSSTLSAPIDTRKSILSVFYQQLKALTNKEKFLNTMCESDFDMERVCDNKMALFLSYEDDNVVSVPIIKSFINQALFFLTKRRTLFSTERFHFVFNEFLLLGNVSNIIASLILSPKYGIDFLVDINSIDILKKIYGLETACFIIDSCKEWVLMSSKDIMAIKKNNCFIAHIIDDGIVKVPAYLEKNEALIAKASGKMQLIKLNNDLINIGTYEYSSSKDEKNLVKIFDIKGLVEARSFASMTAKLENIEDFYSYDELKNLSKDQIDSLIQEIDKKISELELQEQMEKIRNNS